MLINIYAILCVVHMSSKRWVIIPFRRAFAKYLTCDMLNQFESIISIDTMRFKKGPVIPSLSILSVSLGFSPMSIVNMRIFGVTVDILLLKQYL